MNEALTCGNYYLYKGVRFEAQEYSKLIADYTIQFTDMVKTAVISFILSLLIIKIESDALYYTLSFVILYVVFCVVTNRAENYHNIKREFKLKILNDMLRAIDVALDENKLHWCFPYTINVVDTLPKHKYNFIDLMKELDSLIKSVSPPDGYYENKLKSKD